MRRGFRRLIRDTSGATAIEFAFVALPFFLLLFAILETFLLFFASQTIETATFSAARQIRTGQAQAAGLDETTFKNLICNQIAGILNCADNLHIDVRTVDGFAAVDLADPINDDGELDDEDFGYDAGGAGEIVVVRAFLEWPLHTNPLGLGLANLADGGRLIATATAFRNEPF